MSSHNNNNMRIKNRNNKRKKKNDKSNNSGASVKKRPKTSSRTVSDDDSEIIESVESEALPETFGGETKESDSGGLFFLLFTVASCGGLWQGCDQCNPKECEPEEANAIRKDGIIYKQIGRELKRTFASLTCLFIRVQNDFTSVTAADRNMYNLYSIFYYAISMYNFPVYFTLGL